MWLEGNERGFRWMKEWTKNRTARGSGFFWQSTCFRNHRSVTAKVHSYDTRYAEDGICWWNTPTKGASCGVWSRCHNADFWIRGQHGSLLHNNTSSIPPTSTHPQTMCAMWVERNAGGCTEGRLGGVDEGSGLRYGTASGTTVLLHLAFGVLPVCHMVES